MNDSVQGRIEQASPARYSPAGDEFLFVELSEAMNLEAFFRGVSITGRLRERALPGVIEVCPANASYQVRYDPDRLSLSRLTDTLEQIDAEVQGQQVQRLETRVVEVPVLYNDPWTHETLMRFRDRHQDPTGTDLEYAARINGFTDVDGFIEAHSGSPWFVSMVGFVAGLPFMYQMVPRERQLQVPKYVRPRTDTPKQTVGYGGCFSCIYSVRGAGGYQMFGVTPMPIYDPSGEQAHIDDSMIYFRPGDIVKHRAIERSEYDAMVADAEAGRFRPRTAPFVFDLNEYREAPEAVARRVEEVLDEH
ncbi:MULTISPECIES: 5-oxoprolinase subunit B family protein [Halomonas]|uniref:5-oxoprolinase subunit B family protein n=1 Tax=Halomonas TaxID=2745 RepID=UPI001C971553|nr:MULTISPECIES: carboxyltransferase domain-containing protein [Halomonas]MBY6207963.1 carboxyltransferase domain-containing protein [Halomonas sp. DP3Y7-2]MBY6228772.1 carboxyltransferase domain-containing protein [Halomonas sp. DP3Y7-1]MCA0917244.1 carboxyltransferase domain-containing protein [Halomonas denitrificans]